MPSAAEAGDDVVKCDKSVVAGKARIASTRSQSHRAAVLQVLIAPTRFEAQHAGARRSPGVNAGD